ncbi:MAG TPA: plastocyanin/azurin family copper-binding protein [Candidatus Limnocylindrales bacterium]|jgi:plastocyanin|nr:plastocyanin/azurin family copper-binding protein [Candidatus Limnocylindrales bacterium]
MSRTILALCSVLLLVLSACGGATASAPATAAPASEAPASEAPASAPTASETAAAGEAACAPSSEIGSVSATMANFAFSPASITASVGDVITWTNNDSAPHTATVTSDPTCTTDSLASGATGSLVFNTAGSYEFFCKIHPTMKGTIEVS